MTTIHSPKRLEKKIIEKTVLELIEIIANKKNKAKGVIYE